MPLQVVVNEEGRLIFDKSNRICVQNNGTLQFVPLDHLPPNFLHDILQTSTEDASTSYGISRDDQMQTSTEDASTSYGIARADQNSGSIQTFTEDASNSFGIARVDQNSDLMQTSTEDASTSYGIARADQNSGLMQTVTEDTSNSFGIARVGDSRAHWTRGNILRLISAYKEHHELFRSNSVKNSEAWRRVAEDVPGFSARQCEAKFKYLKSLYTKRKDNMGSNSSGARAITFEYFEEFDDIFHQEPNITPVAIASSSSLAETPPSQLRSNTTPTHAVSAASHEVGSRANLEESARPLRRKRTRLEIQLEKFQRNMELREQARERRMNRFLEQQEVCTNRLCDMMQKFIDKL